MTVTSAVKRRKKSGASFAYVDRVMNGLARSIKESNEDFAKKERDANEAFRKEMRTSHEEFARTEREAREAFSKEMRESQEAFQEAFSKEMRESQEAFQEAFRKEIRASFDESDKRYNTMREKSEKEWNIKMGDIYNRLGDLAEYTFVPEAILEKFKELNYEFDNYCRRERVIGKDGCAKAEYDGVLRNGDTVALVEVKSTLKYEYVDRFIQQISVATNEMYRGK